MKIIPCGTEHFEELVNFVVRLNSDDTHHIGFFGEGEADVRSSLAECLIPPAEGFLLAYDGGQLVGVFGVDVNPEIGRAWLFGPLIEHANGIGSRWQMNFMISARKLFQKAFMSRICSVTFKMKISNLCRKTGLSFALRECCLKT